LRGFKGAGGGSLIICTWGEVKGTVPRACVVKKNLVVVLYSAAHGTRLKGQFQEFAWF